MSLAYNYGEGVSSHKFTEHHINLTTITTVTHLNIFPTTTRRTQKRKTGELTVKRGVCMKSNNQRKGPINKTKWVEPKYVSTPPEVYSQQCGPIGAQDETAKNFI